jgi:hypothetical protein
MSGGVDRGRFVLLLAAGIALVAVKPAISDVGTDRLYEIRHVLPAFEYPVLARAVFLVERALSDSRTGIALVNAVVGVGFAVLVLRLLPGSTRRSVWASAPILVLAAQTMDAITCVLLVLLVLAWREERWLLAGAWAGVGAAFKVVPAVAAVPLALAVGWRRAARMAAAGAVVWLAVNVPYALFDFERWRFPYRFAAERDDIVSTIWAPWHLSIGTVNRLSLALTVALLVVVAVAVVTRAVEPLPAAALAVLAFVVANKVWQPHYAIWLVALVPFTAADVRPVRALELTSLAYFAVFWSEAGVTEFGGLVWIVAIARLAAAGWLAWSLLSRRSRRTSSSA